MGRAINRVVILIVNALDNIGLFAHARVGKGGVSSGQIFQVRFK